MADIIRSAGASFLEKSKRWMTWQHRKVLQAILRCRTAALGGHRDRCSDCGQVVAISYNSCGNQALSAVPGQRPPALARGAGRGTSAHSLRPRGIHPAARTGASGAAEQEGGLRPAVSRQCGDAAGGGPRADVESSQPFARSLSCLPPCDGAQCRNRSQRYESCKFHVIRSPVKA